MKTSLKAALATALVAASISAGAILPAQSSTIVRAENTSAASVTSEWRSWSPVLTGINPGAGKVAATYRFSGGKVEARLSIVLGTGFAMGYNPSISLPITAATPEASFAQYVGAGSIYAAGNVYPVVTVADNLSATAVRPFAFAPNTSGYLLLGAASPAAWAVGSSITLEFSYYPASTAVPATFGAIGDSMTAWRPEQNAYNAASSWTNFVPTDGLAFAGGWARGGGTTTYLVANPTPLAADAVVILAGVNDIYNAIPLATTLANVETLATQSGADDVVLSALAPYDVNPAAALAMSVAYSTLASAHGWVFVDPWTSVRTATGTYVAGASPDGVHPGPAAQAAAAAVYRTALLGL